MSTFASLLALERTFGVRTFMLRESVDILENFLSKTQVRILIQQSEISCKNLQRYK
jgi:hypothetical protein